MNDFNKINAFNNIPQFISEIKDTKDSTLTNSTFNSNKTNELRFTIYHRKSRSIDVKMEQINETNPDRTSIQETSEKTNNYIKEQNNQSLFLINKSSDIKDKKIFPDFNSNKLNNGHYTQAKENQFNEILGVSYIDNDNKISRDTSICNANYKSTTKAKNPYRSSSSANQQNKSFVSDKKEILNYNSNQTSQNKNIIPLQVPRKLYPSHNSVEKDNKGQASKSPFSKIQMFNGSKHQPKPLDRLDWMYKKGLEKVEKFRKLHEESTVKRKMEEIAECTFKPKLNKIDALNHIVKLKQEKIPMHERQKIWNEKKQDKIEKEKLSYKIKEQKECTFVPDVMKKPMDYFNYDVKNDKNIKRYINRLDQAKKLKEEVKEKNYPDYNERYEKLVRNKLVKTKGIKNDINTEDMISRFTTFNPNAEVKLTYDTAIKNLHSRLHSIELFEDD